MNHMEKKEFVRIIQACQCRLNIAGFLRKLVSALCVGAVIGILFQAAAFVTPLYYVNIYTATALLLALITALMTAYAKRTDMGQTALVMDSFGFDERIVTAYDNLEKEGTFIALQRADAMRQLKAHQDRIQIPLLPPLKKIASLTGLLVAMIVLALVPSGMKERAAELYSIREEVREKAGGIEEVVEALEQLVQEETLTPQQQAQLQEMIENLQASQEEYQQAASSEMLKAASEKLEYRYENMGSQLAGLAQSMKNGATVSPVTADSLQALSEKMQEMSGSQLAMQNTSGQNGNNNGNGQNNQGNQNGNGQSGQQGSQSGNNQTGNQNGNGQSGSPGGQNASGQSNGQGENGQNGSGDGDSGNGRGTGSGSTPHDYVSIPNDIADSGNLTGNAIDHDASEYFHAQNGLSWEGTHMSHEAVIGSYEQNAYEGIAAGKYPSGMEEIIKEYFSSFN